MVAYTELFLSYNMSMEIIVSKTFAYHHFSKHLKQQNQINELICMSWDFLQKPSVTNSECGEKKGLAAIRLQLENTTYSHQYNDVDIRSHLSMVYDGMNLRQNIAVL